MVDRAAGGQKASEVAAAAAGAAAADDWRVVDRTLRGLARRRAALDVEEAAWLRRARALGVHRELGFASFFEYVERILGYAPGPARERLRVADALAVLPKLRAAMSAGDVAYSAARELTRVATVDTEAAWLTAAAKHTVREIEEMVTGRRRGDSPDDPPDPAARLHELRLLLPAAVLGKFTAARRALEAACGHPLTDGDLLATLCDGQLAGAVGSHVGDAAAGSHAGDAAAASRPMYQIAITRCPDCMRAWHDVAGHTIEISETELAQASCDAELLGRVDGDKPARVTKTIPPRTRRAVLRRDRGRCVVPGCRNARYVDVHHIVPRVAGGDHTPTKLAVMCSAHHKAAHDGRLRIDGTAPGKLRLTHADGRPYGAPPSHVEAGDAGAPPPAGGEVAVAPAQAGIAVEAPPVPRRRRRAPDPAARRTRGSAKASGRERPNAPPLTRGTSRPARSSTAPSRTRRR
ncbi:MAG: HNH endonuclease [Myxococcales bacterium]|nr:HNH endonuclease [Myxococcales bacterium]